MRRLPARWNFVAMPLVLSIIMSGIVSFIANFRVLGLDPRLLDDWLSAWLLSWMVAFPVLFAVLPLVRKIVGLFVDQPGARA